MGGYLDGSWTLTFVLADSGEEAKT